MSEQQVPPSYQYCATCAYWSGNRKTDAFRQYAIFDNSQRAECCGGGFNRTEMNATASCGSWEKWQILKG